MSQLALSKARKVALVVYINDVKVGAFYDAEVTNTAHFRADTFRLCAALGKLPVDKPTVWWSSTAEISAEVRVQIDSGTEYSLVYGQVDDVDIDLVAGTLVISGRDFSARFIDHKTSKKYVNQTSSQIVKTLAAIRGLKTSVMVNGVSVNTVKPTTTKAGKYYRYDHVVLTQEQTEWDLLIYLAQLEGFDLWVSGEVVYFQPSPQETSTPYKLTWQQTSGSPIANFVNIKMRRALTLASDVIVNVRSWNQAQEKAFTKQAKKTKAASQKSGGKAQIYTYTIANLTPDQCQQRANSLLADITRHERVIEAELPGDNVLNMRQLVTLSGTSTDFDQSYYPDTIERRISYGGSDCGYRMHLRAKNHSPMSTVTP